MSLLNDEFKQEWKVVDKICEDMYRFVDCGQKHGVSKYIDVMYDKDNMSDYYLNWYEFRDKLKSLRNKRNELEHDINVSYTEDYFTGDDIEFIKEFHNMLLNETDPLTIIENERREREDRLRNSSTLFRDIESGNFKGFKRRENDNNLSGNEKGRIFGKLAIVGTAIIGAIAAIATTIFKDDDYR